MWGGNIPSDIIVAILALCGTLVGSIAGIVASNKLVVYRIERLENIINKVDNAMERIVILEQNEKAQWNRIDDMRADIENIKTKI